MKKIQVEKVKQSQGEQDATEKVENFLEQPRQKRGGGRKTKYCKERVESICNDIRGKKGRMRACSNADINYDTFCRWMDTKTEFKEAVEKAERDYWQSTRDDALLCITIKMREQWQAAAWMLERKWAHEFSLHQRVDLVAKKELEIRDLEKILVECEDDEQRFKILQGLEELSRIANKSGTQPYQKGDQISIQE